MAKATARPSTQVSTALTALREIQWMARRRAQVDALDVRFGESLDPVDDREGTPYRFNTATWLLEDALTRYGFTRCKADRAANTTYVERPDGAYDIVERPSIWADGTPEDFAPAPEVLAVIGEDEVARLQWVVDVMHSLAHSYADGRATYASSTMNDATRMLRDAGFSLAATESRGLSVWVADGWGDGYDRLTSGERAERDATRGTRPA